MKPLLELLSETTEYLRTNGVSEPLVAGIVLGTGLGNIVQHIEVEKSFAYSDIPNFVEATVEFHKGSLLYGKIHEVPVLAMQGRFHFYEGYSMQQITFPIRVMKELGIRYLLLSNAAGGMNPEYKSGDLVILDDHINLLPDNPLRGIGYSFGNFFVDMSKPYDAYLQDLLKESFVKEQVTPKKGVYVAVMGPNLETRAEYRWLRNTGADMVGMSTVPEVIVANQVGLPCAAVSVITDECDPDNLKPINIQEIIDVAGKADRVLSRIMIDVVTKLGRSSA